MGLLRGTEDLQTRYNWAKKEVGTRISLSNFLLLMLKVLPLNLWFHKWWPFCTRTLFYFITIKLQHKFIPQKKKMQAHFLSFLVNK